MQFFRLYQYVVPIVRFPLSYWLWLTRYGYNHKLTLLVLSIPILGANPRKLCQVLIVSALEIVIEDS